MEKGELTVLNIAILVIIGESHWAGGSVDVRGTHTLVNKQLCILSYPSDLDRQVGRYVS